MDRGKLHLFLSYEDNLSSSYFDEFVSSISSDNLQLIIEEREPFGMTAGIKWLMPTAAALFISASYFDGFIKEAGKDHYSLFKNSSITLWDNYLGSKDKPNYINIGTPGKISEDDNKYSYLFSIVSDLGENHNVKFLFKENSSKELFSKSFSKYLDFLHDLSNGVIDSSILLQLEQLNNIGRTILITYDEEKNQLVIIDPIPKEVRDRQQKSLKTRNTDQTRAD